jgi:ParB family chromosome partitioning protein
VVALKLDMTHYWQPTAEGVFRAGLERADPRSRARRHRPRRSGQIDGLKKDAMAKRAEALLAGKAWLPTLLR